MHLREANPQDRDVIGAVYRAAFPPNECEPVAKLAVDLLDAATSPITLSLVAERDHRVVGHVAFSPVFDAQDNRPIGYILAPLAVDPAHQKKGVGTKLVKHGLSQLADAGHTLVLVYGDPAYYGRFGFDAETAKAYTPPYPLQHPFGWQARSASTTPPEEPVRVSCVDALCDPTLW